MTDSDYRLFALDIISEIEDLIHLEGSRRALNIAGRLAARQPIETEVVEAARVEAMNDCFRCSMSFHDGREHAALAAWFVLAPTVEDSIDLILGAVAKARAVRWLCKERGQTSISPGDEELECHATSEFDLLEARLDECRRGMDSGSQVCSLPACP
jgi:hypothetical protein